MAEGAGLRSESWHAHADCGGLSGLVVAAGQVGPLRQRSLNFLDFVSELAEVPDVCAQDVAGGARGEDTSTTAGGSSAHDESCSGLSSNMDFEAQTTAESARQGGCGGDVAQQPLSWSSGSDGCFTVARPSAASAGLLHGAMTQVANSGPVYPNTTVETSAATCMLPQDIFAHAMAEEEVMSMTFTGVKSEAEQHEALDQFLRRNLPDDSFGPPLLAGFDSRDSAHSAPTLGPSYSFSGSRDTEHVLGASGKPDLGLADLARCHSVEVSHAAPTDPASLCLVGRSMSCAMPGVKRSYSSAGPGTNRPPKEGSLSALLPKEKLQRKRAAARRYYHNQKNKAVDYEMTIARLETENHNLSSQLMDAMKQLDILKKAKFTQAAC